MSKVRALMSEEIPGILAVLKAKANYILVFVMFQSKEVKPPSHLPPRMLKGQKAEPIL